MSYYSDDRDKPRIARIVISIVLGMVVVISALAGGCPIYNVWEQGLAGQAALRRAEQDRRIAVQEAQAKLDSATLLANAEIERAKGVAKANEIIGEGLKGHEEYLRYLWIMSLEHAATKGSTIVYIPTEGNLPILEATRGKRTQEGEAK